jgi:lipopolysaccharide export system protein LptA
LKSSWGFIFFLILILLAPGPGSAAPPKGVGTTPPKGAPGGKKPEGEFPLHITAARLEADQNAGIVTFSGQVKAEYGDSTLYADQLRVYYQPSPPAPKAGSPSGSPASPAQEKSSPSPLGDLGGEKIDRIVATGQVRFVQDDRLATGQEAIYYKDKDEVVLLGNPQLWRGENTLKGDRIIFHLADKKTLVESSSQKRVEAHLYSSAPPGGSAGKESLPFGPKGRKGRQP